MIVILYPAMSEQGIYWGAQGEALRANGGKLRSRPDFGKFAGATVSL